MATRPDAPKIRPDHLDRLALIGPRVAMEQKTGLSLGTVRCQIVENQIVSGLRPGNPWFLQ
jgi:hypothetical protein